MQSDCDDTRFTDINGKLLEYDLTGTCNNASTTYEVVFNSIVADDNVGYVYYGNPTAINMEIDSTVYTALTPSGGDPSAITDRTGEEVSEGPIVWWGFDDNVDNSCSGGEDVCDSTSSLYHGTFGGATNPAWQTPDNCVVGGCLNFTATTGTDGSRITYSTPSNVAIGTTTGDELTLSMWLRPDATQTNSTAYFVRNGTDNDMNYGAAIQGLSGGKYAIRVAYHDGTTFRNLITSDTIVTASAWNHIAIVITQGTDADFYVDGVLKETIAWSGSNSVTPTTSFNIGSHTGAATQSIDGFIDEVKIYPYARTAAQINSDFQNTSTAHGASASLGSTNQKFLSDGLVGYWRLEETSTPSLDSSGLGQSGTWVLEAASAAGKFGNGVSFDGVDDAITGNDANFPSGSSARTITAWVNTTDTSGHIFGYGTASASDHTHLSTTSDGQLRLGFWSNDHTGTNETVNDGVWRFVAATFDGTTATTYVDGEFDASTVMTGVTTTLSGEFSIGNTANFLDNSENLNGTVDEVRLYNRALSNQEIADLYNWAPGPVGYWPMDENTGTTTTYDHSTNANNGTLTSITESSWVDGKYGSALTFDGSADFVTYGDITADDFGVGEMTVTAWVKTTSSGSLIQIVDNKTAGSNNAGFNLQLDTSGNPFFRTANGSAQDNVNANISVSDGNWHHLAGVLVRGTSNDTLHIYIDGDLKNSDTGVTAGWDITTSQDLCVATYGATCGTDFFFNGQIDDVRLYNYARTPGQIVEDMNAGHPLGGSPVGSQTIYYSFDELNGTTANDASENQNGTVDSNLTWTTQTSCKINGCLLWNAAGEEVSIATASDAPVDFNGSEAFSGSAWVNVVTMPGSGEQDGIITKWDETGDLEGYRLVVENDDADTTGNFEIEIWDDSANQAISATGSNDSVSQATWYHVAWTFNGGTAGAAADLALYVDGVNVGTNAANASFLGLEDVASDFDIGEYDPGDAVATNTAFAGYIDEVKIYNDELTASQVLIDMNAGGGINFSVGSDEAADLADGAGAAPTGYWPMDEKTGTTTTVDKSGNGRDATLASMTESSWIQGKVGSALAFDGSADEADTNVALSTFITASAGTMTAWVKPTGTSPTQANAYNLQNVVGDVGQFAQITRGTISGDDRIWIYNWDGTEDRVGITYNNDEWTHVAWVHSGGTLYAYKNGVLAGSTASGDTTTLTSHIFIGGNTNSTEPFFEGDIDEVKIYNYARTASQIAYDYNRGAPVHHYQFDECEGSIIYDIGSAATNGTITIGGSGTYTSLGTCGSGTGSEAWNGGTTGKFNGSIAFEDANADDYASVSSPTLPTGDFTYATWVYYTDSGTDTIVGASDGTNVDELKFRILGNSGDVVHCQVDAGSTAASTIALIAGNWYHLVCSRSGSTVTVYINGVADGTATEGDTLNFGSCPLVIGADDDDGNCTVTPNGVIEGQIDDLRVYNYALSAAQIRKVMLGGDLGSSASFRPNTGSP